MIFVNGSMIDTSKRFPDGTSAIKFAMDTTVRSPMFYPVEVSWLYDGDDEMVSLLYIVNHLRDNYSAIVDLFMPYVPNARMDRVKTEEDVFTLKYFAEFINSLYFNKVTILDPHSDVTCALISNLRTMPVDKIIANAQAIFNLLTMKLGGDPEKTYIFYPDSGAYKRYSSMSKTNRQGFGVKQRDWQTGLITSLEPCFNGEFEKGSDVIIIDDICSKGGTFMRSARALKEAGANNIFLYCTHCENTVEHGEILSSDLITSMVTTNSICRIKHPKITVLNLTDYTCGGDSNESSV